jgi:LacI family transcriptional regulator
LSITIKDIATMAGVSISTVSRVINNSKPVKHEVRERIMAVIEETQFRPNANARSLVKNESFLIGVIVSELKNSVVDEFIYGINAISQMYGYDILLSMNSGTFKNELHYLNLFHEIRTDGIILMSSDLKEDHVDIVERFKIPCVMIGSSSNTASIPTVHIDNVTAAYEAVTYLIRNGHRKIAMIRGNIGNTVVGDHRFLGYRQALADAGIPIQEEWIVVGGLSTEDGMRSMSQIVESGSLPTAVFCATDRLAIGAMNYLRENENVQDDISVFGFDDIDLSKIVRPTLSTVKYSAEEIGMTAMRNLIKLIKGDQTIPQHTNLPHHLVIRDSVRTI